jgi:REP element-mobilizing transposase RayT
MPDHVHFFARSSLDAMPIAKWMGVWKTVSAKRIALTASATTPVWQRDYFDRYLRSSESYAEKWEYVRQNPVRAGLVTDAESWSYWGKIGEIEF